MIDPAEMHVRRRVRACRDELAAARADEIARAAELQKQGNRERAAYYLGLADGRHEALQVLRGLMRDYPESSRPVRVQS